MIYMLRQEILPTISNYLFEATSLVNNRDRENYVYSGYAITFDSLGFCTKEML